MRCRIVDVKSCQSHKYGDNLQCRCCSASEETLDHVLCECPALADPCNVGDEFSEDMNVLERVVRRTQEFLDKVDSENEDGEVGNEEE